MCKTLKIICAILVLSNIALAQNLIDHISTLYPSGYGKLALDGDTLYMNTLNGHGVERYNVADPANPTFIDREEASGFDQIDFNRRVMATIESTDVTLIDYSNFNNTRVASHLPLILPAMRNSNWKIMGNYMLAVSNDDTMRTFDISLPDNPSLVSNIGLINRNYGRIVSSIIGSTVCVIISGGYDGTGVHLLFLDRYDIRDPDSIHFAHSDTFRLGSMYMFILEPAKGDTLALSSGDLFYGFDLALKLFTPDSITSIQSFGQANFYTAQKGFIINYNYYDTVFNAYSYDVLSQLGKVPCLRSDTYFNFCPADYPITISPNRIRVFSPTYSDSVMPEVYSHTLPHYGILSSCAYGGYILSGAESNGGELLIHQYSSGRLNFVSALPGVQAKKIIIDSTFALCYCPNKITQVDISNPASPHIEHESDVLGTLVDFDKSDTLIYAIDAHSQYILSYHRSSGFNLLSSFTIQGDNLTGVRYFSNYAYILKGNIGIIDRISVSNPLNPYISMERRLPHQNYRNLDMLHGTLWASCPNGTDIVHTNTSMDSINYFGPEYFSDVHQMIVSNDTLYVADGISGIRIYSFSGHPYQDLHYIGGYSTGNVVNQLCTIGNNFFVSDYYSLQQLRWGAPTEIERPESPNRPEEFSLMQNYPNPFNAQTTIRYNLPSNENASLSIFDITGREVRQLDISGNKNEIIWDGANSSGQPVASGIYFYTINGHTESTHKMILLR